MYKILTAVAVVAVAALGTTIIATVLLRSSISKQSGQIGALEHAEHSEQQKIAALEGEVGGAGKHKKLTAVRRQCTQLPDPIGLTSLTTAGPQLLFTIRQGVTAPMRPSPALCTSDLLYSGLPWRHAP